MSVRNLTFGWIEVTKEVKEKLTSVSALQQNAKAIGGLTLSTSCVFLSLQGESSEYKRQQASRLLDLGESYPVVTWSAVGVELSSGSTD